MQRAEGVGTMTITLPYPPSLNRLFRVVKGRMILSSEYRQYKAEIQAVCMAERISPVNVPVRLNLAFYRPRKVGDLDNTLKAFLDSLNGIVYEDDSQIVEIHAYRYDDKNAPRVEVSVQEVK